jgi:hypothetical protein
VQCRAKIREVDPGTVGALEKRYLIISGVFVILPVKYFTGRGAHEGFP